MAVSQRIIGARAQKFNKRIHARGQEIESAKAKKSQLPVGPVVLGFFLFVVVGSALLQIVRSATFGN